MTEKNSHEIGTEVKLHMLEAEYLFLSRQDICEMEVELIPEAEENGIRYSVLLKMVKL